MQNIDSVIFNPIQEVIKYPVTNDYRAVEFDPANFNNEIKGFAIGSLYSMVRRLVWYNSLNTESTLDNYVSGLKEKLSLNLMSTRGECKFLVSKLNSLETEVHKLIDDRRSVGAICKLDEGLKKLLADY
jgi:hypothetical protein